MRVFADQPLLYFTRQYVPLILAEQSLFLLIKVICRQIGRKTNWQADLVCCNIPCCRVPQGTVDVVLTYCHYSLNDTTLEDLVPYLKSKGVGIVNAGVLSMGLLTKYVGTSEHRGFGDLYPMSPEPRGEGMLCIYSIPIWQRIPTLRRVCVENELSASAPFSCLHCTALQWILHTHTLLHLVVVFGTAGPCRLESCPKGDSRDLQEGSAACCRPGH